MSNRIVHKKCYRFPYLHRKFVELTMSNRIIPFCNDFYMNEPYKSQLTELCNSLKIPGSLTQDDYISFALYYDIEVVFGLFENKNAICIHFKEGTYSDGCNYKMHFVSFDSNDNMVFSIDFCRYKYFPEITQHATDHLIRY